MIQGLGMRDWGRVIGFVVVALTTLGLAVTNGAEGGALALRVGYVVALLTAVVLLTVGTATGRILRLSPYAPVLSNVLLLLIFPAAWTDVTTRLAAPQTPDLVFGGLYGGALLVMIGFGVAQGLREARGARAA